MEVGRRQAEGWEEGRGRGEREGGERGGEEGERMEDGGWRGTAHSQPFPSDSEFVQLESEMETELREIEEMLARFTDSDPPSSSTPCDQEPCSGYRR